MNSVLWVGSPERVRTEGHSSFCRRLVSSAQEKTGGNSTAVLDMKVDRSRTDDRATCHPYTPVTGQLSRLWALMFPVYIAAFFKLCPVSCFSTAFTFCFFKRRPKVLTLVFSGNQKAQTDNSNLIFLPCYVQRHTAPLTAAVPGKCVSST